MERIKNIQTGKSGAGIEFINTIKQLAQKEPITACQLIIQKCEDELNTPAQEQTPPLSENCDLFNSNECDCGKYCQYGQDNSEKQDEEIDLEYIVSLERELVSIKDKLKQYEVQELEGEGSLFDKEHEIARDFLIKELNMTPLQADNIYTGYISACVKFAKLHPSPVSRTGMSLQEAANNHANNECRMRNYYDTQVNSFIAGAEWQSQQQTGEWIKPFLEYSDTLKNGSFTGWSDDQKGGYMTALISLTEWIKNLSNQ